MDHRRRVVQNIWSLRDREYVLKQKGNKITKQKCVSKSEERSSHILEL